MPIYVIDTLKPSSAKDDSAKSFFVVEADDVADVTKNRTVQQSIDTLDSSLITTNLRLASNEEAIAALEDSVNNTLLKYTIIEAGTSEQFRSR